MRYFARGEGNDVVLESKKNCENSCAKDKKKCAKIPTVYSEDANRFRNLFDSKGAEKDG